MYIYNTFLRPPFLPLIIIIIIINQSILATHINSEVEKLDVYYRLKFHDFFYSSFPFHGS